MKEKLFRAIFISFLCLVLICIAVTGVLLYTSEEEPRIGESTIKLLIPFAVMTVAAAVLALHLSRWISKRVLRPLCSINLEKPLENRVCEELSPLLERLELQHREIEEKRKELLERHFNMEFAEESRREFTANVSHELKTPLQSIMGGAELIENGLVKKEDIPQFAGNIRRESKRLLSLIDDIIHLSRLDENSGMELCPVDLYEICRDEVAAIEPIAGEIGVQLQLMGEHITVSAVPQLVREIAHNLIDNAVKYNKTGGRVTVRVNDSGTKNILSVSDTGIGIPEEHRDRIFERFYRVDKSHSKASGGTGLGLSIVKHAASYMGAELALDSEVGVGTTVTVKFPK